MLNELENKIRKTIPELLYLSFGKVKPIQLNHVLEYVLETETYKKAKTECWDMEFIFQILQLWNLKSNLLFDQSKELIKYLNEL